MNALSELCSKRWIIKEKDKEKYYQIKDTIGMWQELIRDKLGYRLIDNSYVLKLEKLPGEAQPWMGITEFQSKEEYVLFCLVLMFLEDKEKEEAFVLSQLTEYLQANYPEGQLEWTVFENRRKLIRVMKYAMKQGLILNNDGNEDDFASALETEVLYENTGISKYFARSFTQDISEFTKPEDFFQSDWMEMNEDRGIIRRQRVYRKLLLSPGVYREQDKDEDFAYIKSFRSSLEHDLEAILDGSLHVHRTSAFFILDEMENAGCSFPGNNNLSDAILLVFSMLQQEIKVGNYMVKNNETIVLSQDEFNRLLIRCKQTYGSGFAKKYREEMSEEAFAAFIKESMLEYGMIQVDPITEDVTVMPIAGKICGMYSKEFLEKEKIDVNQ